MVYVDLVLNLFLLVALSVLLGFIEQRYSRHTRAGAVLRGALFGTAAVIGMLAPLVITPGLICNGRRVMLSLCNLIYGPWVAAIAAVMGLYIRGMGIFTGVLVILSSVGIRLVVYFRMASRIPSFSAKQLYLFGLAVPFAMLVMMVALPQEQIWLTLKRIGPPVLLFCPLATVLAGKILSDQVDALRHIPEVQAPREQLDVTLKSIGDEVISTDLAGRVQFMNPVAEALIG